jgi:signal transduction histidine kinase
MLMQNLPEESVTILADGRQIWRVFDNLLNNACKYALPGTRVYLDVKCDGETVEIIMKNISATPLNISADALMERFVRGDASRHTEGSGLGLSIAKDLTALQNGVLDLKTDGDLFKAILRFPVYHVPEEPAEEAAEPETPPAE